MWDDPDTVGGARFEGFDTAWFRDRVVITFSSEAPPWPFDTITYSLAGKQVGEETYHEGTSAGGPERP